jgi:hypothetical protein
MACVDPFLQFDDESFALELQLEEIAAQRELQSGKWTEDSPPDFALAFNDFETELKNCLLITCRRTITPSSSITPRMLRTLYPISCLQKPGVEWFLTIYRWFAQSIYLSPLHVNEM